MSATTLHSDRSTSQQMLAGAACWPVNAAGRPANATLSVCSPLGDDVLNLQTVEQLTEMVCERRLPSLINKEPQGSADRYQLMAIPVLDQQRITSVLCLIIRDDPAYSLAIENWKPANGRSELILESGYYGPLRQFRKVSLAAHFLYGVGLPGRAWKQRQPIILHPLTGQQGFLRAKDARQEGLEFGIAVPVLRSHLELEGVLLLLSTAAVSFADECQIWKETQAGLQLEKSYPSTNWNEASANSLAEVTATVERALTEQRAVIEQSSLANETEGSAGITICVLPILRNSGSRSALVFLMQSSLQEVEIVTGIH